MPSDRIDFTHRVEPQDLPEWMDEPSSYEDFQQCLHDLGQVNRLTLSYRPTLHFLDRVIEQRSIHPLRIVDVGSGGGDMLRRVAQWAKQRSVAVSLVGIDLNPYAKRAATSSGSNDAAIEWITGNAYSYHQPIDVVISSLFTHHLSNLEVIQFLRWSDAVAARAWFVNDLVREETPYTLFGLLARAMRWHRFVQHDGPISFRRSFREQDWQRMLAAADVPAPAVELRRWTPGRLCVGRIK
jgi:SAM-dependent methyltransferase